MMKKWILWMLLPLLLCGCAGKETMETVADQWDVPAMASKREIVVEIPGEADLGAVDADQARLYMSNDYEIILETLEGGDLDGTISQISGFHREDLTVMETQEEGFKRYEFVWTSAGENGDRLGHGIVLDDGSYHYCMTVLRDADKAQNSQVVWSQVYQSFSLS